MSITKAERATRRQRTLAARRRFLPPSHRFTVAADACACCPVTCSTCHLPLANEVHDVPDHERAG